jgi:hypothetical protein
MSTSTTLSTVLKVPTNSSVYATNGFTSIATRATELTASAARIVNTGVP